MVCEEYHDTRNVLDKSLEEICRNEKVLPHQVFSIFFFVMLSLSLLMARYVLLLQTKD